VADYCDVPARQDETGQLLPSESGNRDSLKLLRPVERKGLMSVNESRPRRPAAAFLTEKEKRMSDDITYTHQGRRRKFTPKYEAEYGPIEKFFDIRRHSARRAC
jgi:hypothetical protein